MKPSFIKFFLFTMIISLLVMIGIFSKIFFTSNTSFKTSSKEIFIPSVDTKNSAYDSIIFLVDNLNFFRKAAELKKFNPSPGRYILKKGMSNNEIINNLRSKNKPLNLTFNNKLTIAHFSSHVSNYIEPDSISIIESFYDKTFLITNNLNKQNVFSICLPNTYQFFWNTSANQFRDRMHKEYNKFWNKKREEARKKINLTRTEVSILASIVQMESYRNDERKMVAKVYLNRLKKRMRLQADPTVIFAKRNKLNNYNLKINRVLYEDLKINSPYNTYMFRGLPPGPICMPDISSIDAVLFPSNHNYLYFVADPLRAGYHNYATNLISHNKNKKVYTDWLKTKKNSF